MAGELLAPALTAVIVGATLNLSVFGTLEAFGPVGREEATVEARSQSKTESGIPIYKLVLRTASGERFEAEDNDRKLDLEPGLPVRLEISDVGRMVQAVEAGGHRTATGDSAIVLGVDMLLVAVVALFMTRAVAAGTQQPALTALSVAAGLAAGALPVLLLF